MNPEAQALLGPCGLPSANWRGSGCHLLQHEGTAHLGQRLDALEQALARLGEGEHDTWASYGLMQHTANQRPHRR